MTAIVPTVPTKSGNTRQISPAKKWCFTLHDYSKDDVSIFNSLATNSSNSSSFIIFSEETGAEDETPHLQGYVEFKKKVRPVGMFANKTIHWEKTKGSKNDNILYIEKEGGNVYINGNLKRIPKFITNLFPWQQSIVNACELEPDDRSISWIWESEGNTGKSALTKYICHHYNAICVSNRAGDMKYGILKYKESKGIYPDIILIDIPRSVDLQYVSYTGIEEIKNGCFFNTKYECDMVIMPNPHIFIFSNEKPDMELLSKDRWNIITL